MRLPRPPLAAASQVAIVFVSQWTSEGMDMPSLNFTDVIHTPPVDQDALVAAVAAANPHTIVVMENAERAGDAVAGQRQRGAGGLVSGPDAAGRRSPICCSAR